MTKQTLYTGLAWLLIFCLNGMLSACQSDNTELLGTKSVTITLRTATLTPAKTRAKEAGVEDLNENVIKQVDLFLYPQDNATGEPAYFMTFTENQLTYSEPNKQATLKLDLPLEAYYKLFPQSDVTECKAFVIANRSAEAENPLPDSKTIASLKTNTVLHAPDFNKTEGTGVAIMQNKKQGSFVMYGEADLTRNNRNDRNLSGYIPVQRVAAKVSLELSKIADEVSDENGVFWVPDKEHVYVAYRHQMVRTQLGMRPAESEHLYTPTTGDMMDMNFVKMKYVEKDDDKNELSLDIPFYTYPADWRRDENSRPYLVLVVNWKKEGSTTGEHQVTYYEVPVNDAQSYVQNNSYYHIIQEVDVLGSTKEETPVTLLPSFMILKWGDAMTGSTDKTDTDAALDRIEYLVVDETNIEMHNVKSQEIFFFSSQPIEVVEVKMKHLNVNDEDAVYEDITGSLAVTDGEYVFTPTTSTLNNKNPLTVRIHNADPDNPDAPTFLTVKHELINEMSKTSDYTDYKFEITIQHQGDDRYEETIKITQYPMIPVKAEQNSDYNNDGSRYQNRDYGFVYINNQRQNSSNNWYKVSGMSGGSNSNPNRYIITVTSLTTNEFIIGDPRSSSSSVPIPDNNLSEDDNGHKLTFYYQTENSIRTINMISPQFMIASSYGMCPSGRTKDDVIKRCAAYQEDGYPAGRWRVPTRAEIKYIMTLSEWTVIPFLFNPGGNYWSANGPVKYDSNQGVIDSNEGDYVRCVYDTWYWGTDQLSDKNKFVYGDKEM